MRFSERSITVDNTNQNTTDIISKAIEKIKAELESFYGGQKEEAVSTYVSTVLQDFCKQDERFADVIYKFKRTLSDCCEYVMRGCSNHISDIDVYRGAVKFYFPNADVEMNMVIHVTGEAPREDEILKEAEKPAPKAKKQSENPKKDVEKPKKTQIETKTKPKKEKRVPEKAKEQVIQLTLF
jgi:polyhydroxyalkanoate synthesis regulator protein